MLDRDEIIDLDAIRADVNACRTYNFGMRQADRLAHEHAPALIAEVERLRAAHDLIASVAATGLDVRDSIRALTSLAPAWDEEALGSLLTLAAQWDAQAAHNADQGGDFWKGMVVKGRECADDLRRVGVLAREHTPVKPDREAIVRAMHAEVCCPCDPTGCDVAEVSENRYADAVLALLPGRSEAEVKAEALSEAADEMDADPEFRDPLRLKADWLRARADRIEKETDRG